MISPQEWSILGIEFCALQWSIYLSCTLRFRHGNADMERRSADTDRGCRLRNVVNGELRHDLEVRHFPRVLESPLIVSLCFVICLESHFLVWFGVAMRVAHFPVTHLEPTTLNLMFPAPRLSRDLTVIRPPIGRVYHDDCTPATATILHSNSEAGLPKARCRLVPEHHRSSVQQASADK